VKTETGVLKPEKKQWGEQEVFNAFWATQKNETPDGNHPRAKGRGKMMVMNNPVEKKN